MTDKAYPELPEPADELAMEDGFNVIGTQPVFTADQMRAFYDLDRPAAGSGISDVEIESALAVWFDGADKGLSLEERMRGVLAMAPATTQAQEAAVGPMAKMAQALREKAAAERSDFDRRVQSGEWGPMPGPETEADDLPDHVAEIEGDDAVRELRWNKRIGAFNYPVGTKLYAAPTQPQPEHEPSPADTGDCGREFSEIEAAAASRYKVVQAHSSMFWSHAVVAGDGTQQLYTGREVECQNMAAKFTGAFLDGAFLACSAPTAPPTAPVEAVTAPVEAVTAQGDEVMPPRPAGYNDASTDPGSPLQRWGKPRHEGAKLLLQPLDDGYWTPWHIANEMLRSAQSGDEAQLLAEEARVVAAAQCDGGSCGIGGYCDQCPTQPSAQEQAARHVKDGANALQALEALDELLASARGDEPLNHFAAPLIRQYIESTIAPAEAGSGKGGDALDTLGRVQDRLERAGTKRIGRSEGLDLAAQVGMAASALAAQSSQAVSQPAGDEAQLLADLVSQIDKCNPIDDHGHNFKLNAAYLAAKGSL